MNVLVFPGVGLVEFNSLLFCCAYSYFNVFRAVDRTSFVWSEKLEVIYLFQYLFIHHYANLLSVSSPTAVIILVFCSVVVIT